MISRSTTSRLALLLAAGTLALAGAVAPAMAASPETTAFVANIRPNIDYLDRSSRLALDTSRSAPLKAFAHAEATEQTIAANSLVAWWQTNTPEGTAAALGEPVVVAPVVAPVDTAAGVVEGVGDVVTGRSVAIDEPAPLTVTRRTPAGGDRAALLPAGADNFDRLAALKGPRFDRFYVTTQRDSLRQLSTLYADYISRGDDPALRAMALRELPKINARLSELRRF